MEVCVRPGLPLQDDRSHRRPGRILATALLLSLVLAQAASPVAAGLQESLRIDGAVVEVRGVAEDRAAFEQVVRVLPRALRAVRSWGSLPSELVVTVHPDHATLERATGQHGKGWMRAWSRAGAVDLQSPRTWTRGPASDARVGQLLAHEVAHCVLFEAIGPDRAREVPFWFREGMATVVAGERHGPPHADAVSDPVRFLRSDPAPAYATADRAFRDLVRLHGEKGVRSLLAALAGGHRFPEAFEAATGVALAAWESDLAARLSALAANG